MSLLRVIFYVVQNDKVTMNISISKPIMANISPTCPLGYHFISDKYLRSWTYELFISVDFDISHIEKFNL